MKFIDLNAQYAFLKHEIDAKIQSVLNRSAFILDVEVEEVEENLATYVGRKHCVTCGNGTDALSLSMEVLNIRENAAVFVPTFTFFASAEAVSKAGAQPVFVDINRDTFNICTQSLEEKVEMVLKDKRFTPRAIVAVDLFGMPADFDGICKIANRYNLKIIEDGAQGFGGTLNGERACSFGDISTTSFFPAKPLGCYGDGGAVFVNDSTCDALLRSLRFHGKGLDKYDNVRIGCNSRLDNLQAAILLVKLEAFKSYELDARHNLARLYDENLKDVCKVPLIPHQFTSSYAQYTLTLRDENECNALKEHLNKDKVPFMVYYPRCMHKMKAYESYPFDNRVLPNGEEVSKRVISLPMHPYMKIEDAEIVISSVRSFFVK